MGPSYSIETTERLYRAISGWEFKNFNQEGARRMTDVARGEGKVSVLEEPGERAAAVTFIHKSGNVHRQSIDRQTLAAVQRLQARGAAPVESHIRRVVGRACTALGMEPVRLGEFREHLEDALPEFTWTVCPPRPGGNTRDVSAIDSSLTEVSLCLIQSRDGKVSLSTTVYLLQSLLTREGAGPTSQETLYPVRQLRDALRDCGCTLGELF